MHSIWVGPRLAVSWLTVLPVRGPNHIDRDAARKAISSAPVVGMLLGVFATGAAWCADALSLGGLLGGLLVVGALALLTRGMHIDGLADTADGLGCYGPPERARAVMQSGSAGPFGVAVLVLTLTIQAAGFGLLAEQQAFYSIALAVAVGRIAVVIACRRGILPAVDHGFGALVAGTQSRIVVGLWCAAALVAAAGCVDGRWWQGPVVVAAVLAIGVVLVRHCVRRFGGLSGDVLGAALEITTTLTVVGLLIGS